MTRVYLTLLILLGCSVSYGQTSTTGNGDYFLGKWRSLSTNDNINISRNGADYSLDNRGQVIIFKFKDDVLTSDDPSGGKIIYNTFSMHIFWKAKEYEYVNEDNAAPADNSSVTGEILTNADVIKLSKLDLPSSAIISKIQNSQTNFDVTVNAIADLKKQGVKGDVINEMINAGKPKPAPATNADNNSSAYSQSDNAPTLTPKKKAKYRRVTFGFESGYNSSTLILDGNSSDAIGGGTLGLLFDIRIAGKFYLQTGAYYSLGGGSNINTVGGDNEDWTISTIQIPIDIVFKTGRPGNNHFLFGAGVVYGKNIGGSYTNSVGNGTLTIGSDDQSQVMPTDIGINFDIGLELRSGLFMRLRELHGISNLQPLIGTIYGASTMYSSSEALTIGFLFGKHKKRR